MEILNSMLDTIKTLPAYLKALVLVVLICAVLGYAYITKEEPAPEAAPTTVTTTVTKTVEGLDIKAANGDGNLNISQ